MAIRDWYRRSAYLRHEPLLRDLPRRRELIERAVRPGERVLDVGCLGGALLEHVAGLGGITAAIAGLDLARRARAEGAEARAVELARGVLAGCHGDQATSCIVESCIVLSTMLAATEPEQAVALLERAAEIGGAGVADRLRAEPDLELLAEHERYAALVGQQP